MVDKKFLPVKVLTVLLPAALLCGCGTRPSGGQVLAEVNGRSILASEVEKFYQIQLLEVEQQPSREQEQIQRLLILHTLIDNEILLQRAKRMDLLASDAEVETAFAELRRPYSEQEFQSRLKQRGLTVEDLKNDLRRQASLEKVFNKEVRSRIRVTEAEIAGFYEENKATFNVPEMRFHVAQIVVTPDAEVPVANLRNDKAQGEAEARAKAERIASRLRGGEDFARLAQEFSEDSNTARNNGDLGFIPASALEKADPALRQAIYTLQPGQVSGVIRTRDAYYILRLLGRQAPGQRQLSDPEVQQGIRKALANRKAQVLREAYMEIARNQSEVVNYLARQIMEASGVAQE